MRLQSLPIPLATPGASKKLVPRTAPRRTFARTALVGYKRFTLLDTVRSLHPAQAYSCPSFSLFHLLFVFLFFLV